MYKKIINPTNGKAISLEHPEGIKVLKKYLNVIETQTGGEDNKKEKKPSGISGAVKKKGAEIAEEIIDGPKEVANFFGKKVKSGFSDFFGWKRKSPKKNLIALDQRMIKNIFDSEDSPEADKKFASAKAAELASQSGFSNVDIGQALLTMGQERSSAKGWTKMEVGIAIRFIKSWNEKHNKKWSSLVKNMGKKKVKKTGILGWLAKKTGQARETLLGWTSDTRTNSNVKEGVTEFANDLEKKIGEKEKELGESNNKIKTLQSELDSEKKNNSGKSEDMEKLIKENEDKKSQIETLKKERNIAVSATKDNISVIKEKHKENLHLKKKNLLLQKNNVSREIHLNQRNEANRKIGKANKRIRQLIKNNLRLKETITRKGFTSPYQENKLKLDYQDSMLDLNYRMKQFNNDNNSDLFNKQEYVAKKNQIRQQRNLLLKNQDNSDFLINVFDEDDLIKTKKEYAVKSALLESEKFKNNIELEENELDEDIYEHNKSISKGDTSIVIDEKKWNPKFTPGDVIMIHSESGEPTFNRVKEVKILNKSDQAGGKNNSSIKLKGDPVKYQIIFEKPFEKRHENPDIIITTGSDSYDSFEKIGEVNVAKWLKDNQEAIKLAKANKSASEKEALEKRIKNAQDSAIKKELESNKLFQYAKKLQEECKGKDPSSNECKKADEAQKKATAAAVEADAAKKSAEKIWNVGSRLFKGDVSVIKELAEEQAKKALEKGENQNKLASMAVKYAAPAAGLAAAAGLGVAGRHYYLKYYKNNFFNKMYQLVDSVNLNRLSGGSSFFENLTKFGKKGFKTASKFMGDKGKKLSKIKNSKKYGNAMTSSPYNGYQSELINRIPDDKYPLLSKYFREVDFQEKIFNHFKVIKGMSSIEQDDKSNNKDFKIFVKRLNDPVNQKNLEGTDDQEIKGFINELKKILPSSLSSSRINNSVSNSESNGNKSLISASSFNSSRNVSRVNADNTKNVIRKVANASKEVSKREVAKIVGEALGKGIQGGALFTTTYPDTNCFLNEKHGGQLILDHLFELKKKHSKLKIDNIENLKKYLKSDKMGEDKLIEIDRKQNLKSNAELILDLKIKSFLDISGIKFQSNQDEIDFISSMIMSYSSAFHYIYIKDNLDENYVYNLVTYCNNKNKHGWFKIETCSNSTPPKTEVTQLDKDNNLSKIAEKIVLNSKNVHEKIIIIM